MTHSKYKIDGLTVAVGKMTDMVEFYSNVFDVEFKEIEMYNFKLFSGMWGGMKLLFCPAELAKNCSKQNRHQFDIIVANLAMTIETALKYGGRKMGEISESNEEISIGMYDPDNNSIVLKQLMA